MNNTLKRSQAAQFIDNVRELVGEEVARLQAEPGQPAVASPLLRKLELLLTDNELAPARPCIGEAHSNAFIDNCSVCMPRWGWVYKPTKVT